MNKYCLIILFLFLPISITSQKNIEISGYLLNEKDKPIVGAKISWIYEYENHSSSFDGLITSWKSSEDGFFGFSTEWKHKKRIRIFVEAPLCDCFTPLDISDPRMRKFSQFNGILVTKYRPILSLGEIKTYIRFGKVTFSLKSETKIFIEKIKSKLVYLRIKDSSGNVISNVSVNAAYSEKTENLEFCIPEGGWILELYESESKKNIMTKKIVINKQFTPIIVNLID
jgi:hypothetical protein